MRNLVLFLVLIFAVPFADNIPQRGVNKRVEYISATGDGSDTLPYTPSVSLGNSYLDIAAGNVPGYSAINKFGHNPAVAVTGEDVWVGGGTYDFYPTSAQAMSVSSTDGDDDSGGTGAWEITVFGLDSNWLETSEMVILNGTNDVALQYAYRRMYRGIIINSGSSGTNEGNIIVDADVGGSDAIYVSAGDGQTQQAIYTIPGDRTGYFIKGYVSMGNTNKNGEDALFKWQRRLNNGVTGSWATNGQITLINIGSSYWVYEYGTPAGPLPPKTDIRILVDTASVITSAEAGFDLIMIDN